MVFFVILYMIVNGISLGFGLVVWQKKKRRPKSWSFIMKLVSPGYSGNEESACLPPKARDHTLLVCLRSNFGIISSVVSFYFIVFFI